MHRVALTVGVVIGHAHAVQVRSDIDQCDIVPLGTTASIVRSSRMHPSKLLLGFEFPITTTL